MNAHRGQFGQAWRKIFPIAALVFVIQMALLLLLAERPGRETWSEAQPHSVHLAQRNGTGISSISGALETDPTFYALPDSRSFSGQAWLIPAEMAYEVPRSKAEPRWLAPPPVWGNDFAEFLRTNQPLADARLELPSPPLSKVQPANRTLSASSGLRVLGTLAGRQIRSQPEVPVLMAGALLPDTQVEILVNADGHVVTSRVVDENAGVTREEQIELRRARAEALNLARRITFAPLSTARKDPFADLQTGTLIFQWHTRPAPHVNP